MLPSPHPHQKGRRRLRWDRVIPLCALVVLIAVGGGLAAARLVRSLRRPPAAAASSRAASRTVSSSAPPTAPRPAGGVPVGVAPPAGEKIAYLTFDDGPTEYTPQVLNILNQNGIKATFFIAFMKEDTSAKRGWLKQEADSGMTIGIHSWTHDYQYIYSSEQNFETDFTTMRGIIQSVIGTTPDICRFPGGVGNTISLKYHGNTPIMPTLVDYVEQQGVKPFDWTAGGEDADIPRPTTGQQFVNEIMRDIGSTEHPIILMHDRYTVTVSALPILIQQLRAKGYAFSTLSLNMKSVTQSPVLSRKAAG